MLNLKKYNITLILWGGASVLALFVFFTLIHPQIILDFDDWSCITTLRLPFPFFNYWNPSRVLPEFLYPLCGFIGGAIAKVFPSFGIIRSISLVTGLLLTALVFFYEYLFMKILHEKFSLDFIPAELLSVLFILLHFALFRSSQTDNIHLFRSTNITCCYYYLIPAIVNCCMVMYLVLKGAPPKKKFSAVLFYICLYLVIFSNQFASIILISYCFMMFLYNVLTSLKQKDPFKAFLKENTLYILSGGLYIFSLIADGLGGRGRLYSSEDSVIDLTLAGTPPLSTMLGKVSTIALVVLIVCILLYLFVLFKKKAGLAEHKLLLLFVLCDILVLGLTVLLCARVDPVYILRSEVFFGIGFFFLASLVFIFAMMLKGFQYSSIILALSIVLVFLFTNTPGKTFSDSYSENIDSSTCYAISEFLVQQVQAAIDNGDSTATVRVLESFSDPGRNWPQNFDLSTYLPRMLKLFGVIDTSIEVEIVPDSTLNTFYGVSQW